MSDLYETLGVPKTRLGRRDQEGLPQARPPVPPGPQPRRRRRRRSASRRSRAPTTSSPTRRSASSTTRSAPRERAAAPGGRAAAAAATSSDFDLGDLGDLFGGIFGRGGGAARRPRSPSAAPTSRSRVSLSFEDSLHGRRDAIPVEVETACRTCHGTGASPGRRRSICPECDGRGVVSESQGLFALSQPCPRCRGNGTVVEKPCQTCRGSGRERRTKRYTVKIPAGVKDGTRIRLKGKGEAGDGGGPAGRPLRRHARRAVDALRAPRRRPRHRGAGHVRRGRARRDGRGADARRRASRSRFPPASQDGKLLRVRGRGAPKLKGERQAATCSPACSVDGARRSCRRPSARRSRATSKVDATSAERCAEVLG